MSSKKKSTWNFNIDDLDANIENKMDSLAVVAEKKLEADKIAAAEIAFNDSMDAANAKTVNGLNKKFSRIKSFENEQKDKEDKDFQARIAASGGWEALYDSLDKFQKGELQDSDTNFGIRDERWRGASPLQDDELSTQEKDTVGLRPGKEDNMVTDLWQPEFDTYLLNELNPVADEHYNLNNPFLSIFGFDPSTANKDAPGYDTNDGVVSKRPLNEYGQSEGFFASIPGGTYQGEAYPEFSNPLKATHEYIKREMGQDDYDTLVADAEAKFLEEKGFKTMEAWSNHEIVTKRESELEGLKNYSYRDKKNVLMPILEKMENDAKLASLQTSIVTKSSNIAPIHSTQAGAGLQNSYEQKLDSLYQATPGLQMIPEDMLKAEYESWLSTQQADVQSSDDQDMQFKKFKTDYK